MRKTDLAYVAGLIDGEGCIGAQLHKSKDCSMIFIKVGMADRECVEFLQFLFGGKIYQEKIKRKNTIYVWALYGMKAWEILKEIKPYLILKRSRAEIAIRIFEGHPYRKQLTPMEKFLQNIDSNMLHKLNTREAKRDLD